MRIKGSKYMKNIKKSLTKYLSLVLIVILSALILLYFFGFFKTASYPFDIEQGEGYTLRPAIYLSQGKFDLVYKKALEKPLFVYCEYPPIFLIAQAALFPLLSKTFVAGRLISFLSSLLIAFLIYKIVRKKCQNRKFPIISSLFFLSSNVVFYWGLIARADMLALSFSALGIYSLLEFGENRKGLIMASFLFILSIYTKQTFIAAPLASIIYLFFKDKEKCLKLSISFLLPSALIFIGLNLLTGWNFLRNILIYNLSNLSPLKMRGYSQLFLKISFIPLLMGFFYFLKGKEDFWRIYFLISLTLALFFSLRPQGWSNYFLETILSISVILGLLLRKYEKAGKNLFLCLILLLLVFHIPIDILNSNNRRGNFYRSPFSYRNERFDRKITKYFRGPEGPILIENIGYAIKSGALNRPELLGMKELEQNGVVTDKQIYNYCKRKKFAYIIFKMKDRVPKAIERCIRDRYRSVENNYTWQNWRNVKRRWKIYKLKSV